MFQGQFDVISNKATWQSKVIEVVDEEDGTTTDLTNPLLTVDIVVTIRRPPPLSGQTTTSLATASIANGKVSIPGPGFQWQFEVTDLSGLCPETYVLGAKVTINNFVQDII